MINDIKYKSAPEDFAGQMFRIFQKSAKNFTFQVTEDCNLECTYCYQINKTHHKMDFETAKKYCDMILEGTAPYILLEDGSYPQAAIFEFIGGEPLLQIDLIEQICSYLLNKMIEMDHPWLLYSRFSITSNGTLYFTPKVQNFLKKYSMFTSYNITLDGNKQLHDSCRIFKDGSGSYDLVEKAVKYHREHYDASMGTKLTISPYNVNYLYDAIINLINMGFTAINLNCVFEEGWENNHATILYNELKKIADYILMNDLFDKIYLSIFTEDMFYPLPLDNDQNWCGGNGQMLALDWKGDYYPCIRYMESSLNNEIAPLIIGNIDKGIGSTEEEQKVINELKQMTRSSQSSDECMSCSISAGCAWCSGYNYQATKTLNKRVTYICIMHKARSLANAYFFNSAYVLYNIPKKFDIHLETSEALKIIPPEEFEELKFFENIAKDENRLNYNSVEDYLKELITKI